MDLRDSCKHYPRRNEVVSHVQPVLESYHGLHAEQNDFVYDDGRMELLLCLTGIIPVTLGQATYNCPLAIWLPLDYPEKAPMVRVQPTATLQIKKGRFVDSGGEVTVTYLTDWRKKGEGRSLIPLLQELQQYFGQEYPLVSISSPPPSRPQQPSPQQASRQQSTMSPSPSQGSAFPNRPPLPQNPASGSGRPLPPPLPPSGYPTREGTPLNGHESTSGSTLPARPALPPNFGGGKYSDQRIPSPLPTYSTSSSSPVFAAPPRPPLPPSQSPLPTAQHQPQRPPLPPIRAATAVEVAQVSTHLQPPPRPPMLNHMQTQPNLLRTPSVEHHLGHGRPPLPEQVPIRNGTLPMNHPNSYSSPTLGGSNLSPSSSLSHRGPPPVNRPQEVNGQYQHPGQIPPNFIPSPNQYYSPQLQPQPQPPAPGRHLQAAESLRRSTPRSVLNILDGPEDDSSSGITTAPNVYSSQPQSQSYNLNPSPTSTNSIAPPRPPNPELLALRTRLHSKLLLASQTLHTTTQQSLSRLDLISQDLSQGVPAIQDEISRLEAVRSVCETVRGRYGMIIGEAEGRLRAYEARGEGPEVDEIVCSSTVVYNQLLELVAEDAALEDTIYHLGRALNSETANIDLEQFLKRVRGLAREQFTKRALINKILLSLAVRMERTA